jgi:very-short-patch-repair endonuclease
LSLNSKNKLLPIAIELSRNLRKSSTEAENMLWNKLRADKLLNNNFLRQHPIFYDFDGKESFFIADFYCKKCRLVIEIDGAYHKYQLSKDKHRTEIITLKGLKVIRFTNEEIISSIDTVMKTIEDNLK